MEAFANRTTLITLCLMQINTGPLKFAARKPLTLHCDEVKITYCHKNGMLVFSVSYELRATDPAGDDVWYLTCQYDVVYSFEGEPPTEGDAQGMSPHVLLLAHNHLRELAQMCTQMCGMPPLIIDVAKIPQTA